MVLLAMFINLNFYAFLFLIIFSVLFGLTSSLETASTQNLLIDIVGIENISKGNGLKELFNSSLNAILPISIGLLLTILSSTLIFWTLPVIGFIALIFGYLTLSNFKLSETAGRVNQSFSEVTVSQAINYVRVNKNIYTLLMLGFGMMVLVELMISHLKVSQVGALCIQ